MSMEFKWLEGLNLLVNEFVDFADIKEMMPNTEKYKK